MMYAKLISWIFFKCIGNFLGLYIDRLQVNIAEYMTMYDTLCSQYQYLYQQ